MYHAGLVDPAQPCRPTLEVEAVVRPGDADAGPLLLPLADWAALAGGAERVRPCLARLRAEGRLVDHLGVTHLAFPFWTPVLLDVPPGVPGAPSPDDGPR